jgi:hypothetical protein
MRVGIEPTHKGFAVYRTSRKSIRKQGTSLGEVPKNRLFSTHFSLNGSLTAARILSSSSALLVSAGWYMLPLSVIIPG